MKIVRKQPNNQGHVPQDTKIIFFISAQLMVFLSINLQDGFTYATIKLMDKIVLDTSTIISALIGQAGPSREVLRQCLQGSAQPVISSTLFCEYEDVSQRPRIQELTPLTPIEVKQLLSAFYSVCEWTSIHYLWRPNLKDEGDNFLVELAVASNAQYIVTNNLNDFKRAELTFGHFDVITPDTYITLGA